MLLFLKLLYANSNFLMLEYSEEPGISPEWVRVRESVSSLYCRDEAV